MSVQRSAQGTPGLTLPSPACCTNGSPVLTAPGDSDRLTLPPLPLTQPPEPISLLPRLPPLSPHQRGLPHPPLLMPHCHLLLTLTSTLVLWMDWGSSQGHLPEPRNRDCLSDPHARVLHLRPGVAGPAGLVVHVTRRTLSLFHTPSFGTKLIPATDQQHRDPGWGREERPAVRADPLAACSTIRDGCWQADRGKHLELCLPTAP